MWPHSAAWESPTNEGDVIFVWLEGTEYGVRVSRGLPVVISEDVVKQLGKDGIASDNRGFPLLSPGTLAVDFAVDGDHLDARSAEFSPKGDPRAGFSIADMTRDESPIMSVSQPPTATVDLLLSRSQGEPSGRVFQGPDGWLAVKGSVNGIQTPVMGKRVAGLRVGALGLNAVGAAGDVHYETNITAVWGDGSVVTTGGRTRSVASVLEEESVSDDPSSSEVPEGPSILIGRAVDGCLVVSQWHVPPG